MFTTHTIRCPHCGSRATRSILKQHRTLKSKPSSKLQAVRTECPHCDYLITICQDGAELYSVYSPVIPSLKTTHLTKV